MGAGYIIVPLDKTDPGVFNSEVCVMLRVNSAAQAYPCVCFNLLTWLVSSIPHKGPLVLIFLQCSR